MNQKILNNPAIAKIDKFFQSRWYPVALGAIVLLANILGLDLVGFAVVILSLAWVCICCSNTLPCLVNLLLIIFCVSTKNSPGYGDGGNFYMTPPVLITLGVMGGVAVAALITRLIVSGDFRNLVKKRFLAIGLVVVALVLALSGIGSRWYDLDNVWLIALEIFMLVGLYAFFSATIRYEGEKTLVYFARVLVVALCVITLELVAFYLLHYEWGTPLDSEWKFKICVGWGVSNVIGELMIMLVPACFYLMQKEKHGWAYYLIAILSIFVMVLTLSRNAMLFGAPLAVGLAIYSSFFGKQYKKTYLFMSLGVLVVLGAAAAVLFTTKLGDTVLAFFTESGTDGRGRAEFWARWIEYFKEYPILGAGLAADKVTQGHHSIFQRLAHNTVIQFLGSAGIVGLLGYLFHRVQTVFIYVRRPTLGRSMLGVAVGVFCLMALLDTIFFIPYTLMYYVVMLVISEKDYELTRENALKAQAAASQTEAQASTPPQDAEPQADGEAPVGE